MLDEDFWRKSLGPHALPMVTILPTQIGWAQPRTELAPVGSVQPPSLVHDVGGPGSPSSIRGLSASRHFARVGDLGPNRNLIARRNLADRLSGRGRAARCPTRKRCAGEHRE